MYYYLPIEDKHIIVRSVSILNSREMGGAVCHQGSTKPDIYIDVGHGTLFYSIFSIYFFVFVDISTQNRTNESY